MQEHEFENPELVGEYIMSLQEQLDSLTARNERLQRRIAKLERERDSLREELPRRRRGHRTSQERTASKVQRPSILVPGIGDIPDTPLPEEPVSRPNLIVASVLDEFSRDAFRYEFDLRDITASNLEESLEATSPDLLLVESAYRGYGGMWAGRIARFGRPSPELERLVNWCKAHSVPTVFWVKEDPINHDWFIASASLFDLVLTVDSNMVEVHKRRLAHERVEVLPFAAQPVIHHPPENGLRAGLVAFAGAYYAAKHPERRAQMEIVLEPALELGLHIFDRMDRQHDPRFAWPEIYKDHIVGSLTYPQTLEAYRRYKTFLNVNTVTDSPTMCSRRVYELLASGTRVISGPANALNGVPVEIARNRDETAKLLSKESPLDPQEGIDWVLDQHTMSHRVETILSLV